MVNQISKSVTIGEVHGDVNLNLTPDYQVGSVINELLNALTKKLGLQVENNRGVAAKTIVKIEHNNLKSRQSIIKQYLDHSLKIEKAYQDVDSQIPFGKVVILDNLKSIYSSVLDDIGIDYLTGPIDIEKIRVNSVKIIDSIISKLKEYVFDSNNTPKYKEHIELGVNVVVAHAFIECIIMENPLNDT